MKFGKLPPKIDRRTIPFKKIAPVLPPNPPSWDVDKLFPFQVPNPMFKNDEIGDCVIVGRAHLTFSFEAWEQKKLITINESDVLKEYWKESGGVDSGLVMLDSLNHWRKGWQVGGKKMLCWALGSRKLSIYAFAKLDDPEELKSCVCLLHGCYTGFWLPYSAMEQWNNNQTWDDVGDNSMAGGHCMTCTEYNEIGPVLKTWGKKKQATWKFLRYADELYGVVDNRDKWLGKESPIDVETLDGILKDITA